MNRFATDMVDDEEDVERAGDWMQRHGKMSNEEISRARREAQAMIDDWKKGRAR